MKRSIDSVAVLGSGVMGSGIAAHLANSGIPVIMLDIIPRELTKDEKKQGLTLEDKIVRNRIVNQSKAMLRKQKPSPITSKESLSLISLGNMEDDMEKLSEVDWIIEVVTENLDIKKQLLKNVEKYRKQGTIVSSNTSGISIEAMIEDCSEEMRSHFLGTHFFNPPRYLKLLEVIPTEDTDPEVLSFIKEFGENVIGKGVVEAKDTPNFIANRIGTYGLLVTVREMLEKGYSVGEVDSVTGPLIGRPKSATFRTLDVVGLDTFSHVAQTVYEKTKGEEQAVFELPTFMKDMVDSGMLGAKTGKGFYQKKKNEVFEINPETLEYQERKKLSTPAVEMAKQAKGLPDKMKALLSAKDDRASQLVWSVIKPVLLYSAELLDEIANDIVSVDEAIKWGFGWQTGPFETWDAIGLEESVERMQKDGEIIPEWILEMIKKDDKQFYLKEEAKVFYYHDGSYVEKQFNQKEINLNFLKKEKGIIKKNSGASLIDLGDGAALLEFHSLNNSIGPEIIQMMNESIEETEKNYETLIIGNQGNNFCVGANLALMLMEAQDENFFELDHVIKQFQDMTMNMKYAKKPVITAAFNMSLGGGAEVALSSSRIQASSETYMGLVEVGVGLIPGGGGTKELYLKQLRGLPRGVDFDISKVANDVFEKIAAAEVSTSAQEAIENGFLNKYDKISVNPDHLIHDAKQTGLSLARNGYRPPKKEKIPVVGDSGYAAMLLGAKNMQMSGYASDHDLKIAEKLAYILSGGRTRAGSVIDEQTMLDLEREAFLSLIGEPKTQQRMQHMIVKGKPLRN